MKPDYELRTRPLLPLTRLEAVSVPPNHAPFLTMKAFTTIASLLIALFAASSLHAQESGKSTPTAVNPKKSEQPRTLAELKKSAEQDFRSANAKINSLNSLNSLNAALPFPEKAKPLLEEAQKQLKIADSSLQRYGDKKNGDGIDEEYRRGVLEDSSTASSKAVKSAKEAENIYRKEIHKNVFGPQEQAVDQIKQDATVKIKKLMEEKELPAVAQGYLRGAQNALKDVNDLIAKFSTNAADSAADQEDNWFNRNSKILHDAKEKATDARAAADLAKNEILTRIDAELSNQAKAAEKEVKTASRWIKSLSTKTMPRGANVLLGDSKKALEEAELLINEYNNLIKTAANDNIETATNRKNDWIPKLDTAKSKALGAQKWAELASQAYDKEIKGGLSSEAKKADQAVIDAANMISPLSDKILPTNAQALLEEARKFLEGAQNAVSEYRQAEARNTVTDDNDDWFRKLQKAGDNATVAQTKAQAANKAFDRHKWWMRLWLWLAGALGLCALGACGYFLYRGLRRHAHLLGEQQLLGGFMEEQGAVRIEAGPEGRVRNLMATDAFKKQLGHTQAELTALKLADLFAPANRPEIEAALAAMGADGQTRRPKRIECLLQTKTGGTLQMEGVLFARRNGVQATAIALLEDVSWRNDLADAQARIAALSFHGNEGLLLLDEEQRIVVVNPVFCQWFGLTKSAGELRGLPVDQLGPNFTSLLKDSTVITGAESASKSIQVGDVNLHAEATPVTAGSRQAGRAIFFRDVTAEVQANEKLRPLMERFRDSTPENFHIGMAVIAPDGSVLAASQSMCNFFGYSREELLAQNEQKLRTSGNGAEAAKGSVSQAAVRRSYRRKDGSVVTARVQMTECRDERGALLYSTMSIDDRGANPAPPKPAVWMSKDATEAWCPAVIAPHLPWVSAGFKYEDNYADQADAGIPGWHLSGATRRGRLHAQHGTHREDAFRWETGETFTIACVSDGAGSSKFSRVGSESICRDVTRLIRKALDEAKAKLVSSDSTELTNIVGRAMQESVRQASTSLHELAVKAPCEIKDFRCTMLLVVQYQHASGAVFLGSQVGDGFIQGLMQDGTTQRFGTPDSGKFSGEVSCFLPEVNAVEKAYKIFRIPHEKLQTLLLCTDGIEDAFFPIEKAAEGLFRQLNNGVQQKLDEFDAQKVHGPILGTLTDLVALQAWLDFEKRGENDDRTVLVLHRQQSVSTPPVIAPG